MFSENFKAVDSAVNEILIDTDTHIHPRTSRCILFLYEKKYLDRILWKSQINSNTKM